MHQDNLWLIGKYVQRHKNNKKSLLIKFGTNQSIKGSVLGAKGINRAAVTQNGGVKSLLSQDSAFNQTQAGWRFFNNKNCTLKELSQPLLKAAHE